MKQRIKKNKWKGHLPSTRGCKLAPGSQRCVLFGWQGFITDAAFLKKHFWINCQHLKIVSIYSYSYKIRRSGNTGPSSSHDSNGQSGQQLPLWTCQAMVLHCSACFPHPICCPPLSESAAPAWVGHLFQTKLPPVRLLTGAGEKTAQVLFF